MLWWERESKREKEMKKIKGNRRKLCEWDEKKWLEICAIVMEWNENEMKSFLCPPPLFEHENSLETFVSKSRSNIDAMNGTNIYKNYKHSSKWWDKFTKIDVFIRIHLKRDFKRNHVERAFRVKKISRVILKSFLDIFNIRRIPFARSMTKTFPLSL